MRNTIIKTLIIRLSYVAFVFIQMIIISSINLYGANAKSQINGVSEAKSPINTKFVAKLLNIILDNNIGELEVIRGNAYRNAVIRLQKNKSSYIIKSIGEIVPKDETRDATSEARFARECAGLLFLAQQGLPSHFIPKVLHYSPKERVLILEDKGKELPSLIDLLLGLKYNFSTAYRGLEGYIRSLAKLHKYSYKKISAYKKLLREFSPNAITKKNNKELLTDRIIAKESLIKRIRDSLEKIDIKLQGALLQEINELYDSLFTLDQDAPFLVLTHGDACPGNQLFSDIRNNQHMTLIDFEFSIPANALLDLSYLRMNMPTCWCAKSIPESVINTLEEVYKSEMVIVMPEISDHDLFEKAYIQACGYWVINDLAKLGLLLKNDTIWVGEEIPKISPQHDWGKQKNGVRRRVLKRLKTFLQITQKTNFCQKLRQLSSEILAKFEPLWVKDELETYPNLKCAKRR